MPFTIPNESAASFAAQARLFSSDIAQLVAAYGRTGVRSGCGVTAQGTPDMTVAVGAGSVEVAGVLSSFGTLATSKITLLALAGTLATGGDLAREVSRSIGGTLSGAGTVAKATARTLGGMLGMGGALSILEEAVAAAGRSSFVPGRLRDRVGTARRRSEVVGAARPMSSRVGPGRSLTHRLTGRR